MAGNVQPMAAARVGAIPFAVPTAPVIPLLLSGCTTAVPAATVPAATVHAATVPACCDATVPACCDATVPACCDATVPACCDATA